MKTRKREKLINQMMINNNIRSALRNILQNKGLNSINIIGFAIGMMAVLLIYQYIRFEKSYDRYLDNADRLHRLVFYRYYQTGLDKSVGNNYHVGQIAYEQLPDIENFCRCRKETQFVQAGDEIYKEERTLFADSSFFDIFSFEIISGVKSSFLRNPDVAVITESTARKYFGNTNAVGKTIFGVNPGKKPIVIQGVVRDIPENSHLKFDIVVSLSTLLSNSYCYTCNNTNTYFLLREGSDTDKLGKDITELAYGYLKSKGVDIDFPIEYKLQSVTDIHLHSNYRFEHEINGNNKSLSILMIIALFIFISAGLNYFNLYASLTGRRITAVGTKIVMGAGRRDILSEFTTEALLSGLISLILAYIFLNLLFPLFKNYLGLNFTLASVSSIKTWLFPSLILILTSLIAGTLLGLRILQLSPAEIMKKNTPGKTRGESHKFMLVTQFIIAIFLIAATTGILKQINYMQREALTMNIDQILVIKRPVASEFNSSQLAFQESLGKIPEISDLTYSTITPGENNTWVKGGISVKGRMNMDKQIYQSSVAPGFFDFFDVKLLAGRHFLNDETNWNGGTRHLILNKEAVAALGEESYEKIIGTALYDNDNNEDIGEVVGVVDGYFQNSLDQEIKPTIFNVDQFGYYLFIKIRGSDLHNTVSRVKDEYDKLFKGQYLEYYFLDDFFNAQYKSYIRFNRCFILFSMMAIIIASLSLFGMVMIISSARTKEIGIRKVNGATVTEIMIMLNENLFIWIILAFFIATPLAWYAVYKWLQNFAFKTDLSWWIFGLAGVLSIMVALFTVSWHSWKAATRNPVDALRYE
jgi:putative ABC transport system permease protein